MCAVQRIPIFEVEKIIWLCYTETVRGDQVRIRKIAQLLFLLLLLITFKDAFNCSWDPFSPTGLLCPALIWGL